MSIPSRPLGKTGFNVSLLGLGTVEIGLPYGIGVKNLPSDQEAERILKTAVDMGITYFDTARGYGVAEERIGKSGITKHENIVVGTKCAQFLKQEPDLTGSELDRRIRAEIDLSRQNLRQERLQLVQLHIESPDYVVYDELIDIMRLLQQEEKVQHMGIALRGEAAALAALKTDYFVTLQVAFSILDQRLAKKVMPMAHDKKIGIINRSVLLKGALTSAAEQLPDTLAPLKKASTQIAEIAHELGTNLPSLAIRFAASQPAVATILLGTITPAHLETARQALAQGPLSNPILTKLEKFAIQEGSLIDPSLWPPIN